MRNLQRMADGICVLILSSDLPAIDIEIEKTNFVSGASNFTRIGKHSTKWSTRADSNGCGSSFGMRGRAAVHVHRLPSPPSCTAATGSRPQSGLGGRFNPRHQRLKIHFFGEWG